MLRNFGKWAFSSMLAAAMCCGTTAVEAGWWHSSGGSSGGSSGWSGGSSGWSGGSSGWSGGSSGWHGGSSGGSSGHRVGLLARLHHRWHGSHGSSGGSSGWSHRGGGSSGWSGGSSGYSYGSSGSYSYGSSGGSSGGTTVYDAYESPAYNPAPVYDSAPQGVPMNAAPADAAPALPAGAPMTSTDRANGTLTVEVPADAKIYVNNQLTTTPGEFREYVSRNLNQGFSYSYEVRAEVIRDGKPVTETRKVDLRAGSTTHVAFRFENETTTPVAAAVETVLTLEVPENAVVTLGGNATVATGKVRTYRTTSLPAGATWNDYKIVVTWEAEGQTYTKEKTIAMTAGQSVDLAFGYDITAVADAR